MTTKSTTESSKSKAKERGPWFWILATLAVLALCCLATLVVAWFTGDSVIEFLRNAMVR